MRPTPAMGGREVQGDLAAGTEAPGRWWQFQWQLAGAEKRRGAFIVLATSRDALREQKMRALLDMGLWQDIDRVDRKSTKHTPLPLARRLGNALINLFSSPFEDFKLSQRRDWWRGQMSQAAHEILCNGGKRDTIELLVKAGLNPAWQQDNDYADTLLTAAVRKGRDDLVELLCQAGCDVEAVDSCGETPLKVALWRGRNPEHGYQKACAIIEELLEHGADINGNGRTRHGEERRQTPLFYACLHNDLATIKHLVDNGARVDCLTQMGRGVLHALAAPQGREEIARYLIVHGACVNLQDEAGVSPLAMAAMERNARLAMVLLEAGADPRLGDHSNNQFPGASALHHMVLRMDPAEKATTALIEAIEARYPDCWQWKDEGGCSVAELAQSMVGEAGRQWRAMVEQQTMERATADAGVSTRRAMRI